LDGSPYRKIIATPLNEMSPTWSPSGNQLAYESRKTGESVIWMRSKQEGWERPVVKPSDFSEGETAFFSRPAFSPDGQKLAYHRNTKTGVEIWISNLAGGTPARMLKEDRDQFCPVWSPDGSWMLYVYVDKSTKRGVAKVRLDGSSPSVNLQQVDLYYPAAFSPDGKTISYQTTKGLHIMDANGKNSVFLSTGPWFTNGWSKDGKLIYGVKLDSMRHLGVTQIDVASRTEKLISDLGPAPLIVTNTPLVGFSLAPDGKSFVTTLFHVTSDLWMLEGFDQPHHLLQW
jgi:Tol biopolymer transport system component